MTDLNMAMADLDDILQQAEIHGGQYSQNTYSHFGTTDNGVQVRYYYDENSKEFIQHVTITNKNMTKQAITIETSQATCINNKTGNVYAWEPIQYDQGFDPNFYSVPDFLPNSH